MLNTYTVLKLDWKNLGITRKSIFQYKMSKSIKYGYNIERDVFLVITPLLKHTMDYQ